MKIVGWVWAIVLFVVLLGGYFVALPYITIDDIKTSVQDYDQEKMVINVNIPVLRQNFKQQIFDHIIKSKTVKMHDNPYVAVEVIGLAKKMTDEMVGAYITPAGLTSMMLGQEPMQDGIVVNQQTTENRNIFKDASYSFDNTSTFSARVKTDDDEEVRFVLSRIGLSWKLTNIVFPLQCDACHEDKFIK